MVRQSGLTYPMVRTRQHDPRPQGQRLRRHAPPRPPFQHLPFLRGQGNWLKLRTCHIRR